MQNYKYPTSKELRVVGPELEVELTRTRPTFKYFPFRDVAEWRIEWEVKDNYRGFQQLRGLNGEPSYVKMVGHKRYSAEPGAFGEYMTVDEKQMTIRAASANADGPVDIGDLVRERQDYLALREIDLVEFIQWSLLLNGQFVIAGPTGAIFTDTFPIQTATLSDWSDLDNATPIRDLRNLKLGLLTSTSANFGTTAEALLNSVTLSYVLNNRNPADLGGVKLDYGRSVLGLEDVNRIFVGQDIPTLIPYNGGYTRESDGVRQLWIPNDKVSIIGARPNGEPVGEYRRVRNVNNPGNAPGSYDVVIDHLERRVPRTIEVHRGHNGGPVIYYPGSIVVASV